MARPLRRLVGIPTQSLLFRPPMPDDDIDIVNSAHEDLDQARDSIVRYAKQLGYDVLTFVEDRGLLATSRTFPVSAFSGRGPWFAAGSTKRYEKETEWR